jgi:hypothetical protein
MYTPSHRYIGRPFPTRVIAFIYFNQSAPLARLDYIHQGSLPQASIQSAIERRTLDKNAKLKDQTNWMEQAGFDQVDCMYRYLDFAVFPGIQVINCL